MSDTTELSRLFSKYLIKSGLTHRKFAEKADVSDGYPSHFVAGTRRLPLEKLDLISDLLGLEPGSDERKYFQRVAYIDHAPEEVQKMISALESQVTKNNKKLVEVVALLRGAGVELPKSLRDL